MGYYGREELKKKKFQSVWFNSWLEMVLFSVGFNVGGYMWMRGKGFVDFDGGYFMSGWIYGVKYRKFVQWGRGLKFQIVGSIIKVYFKDEIVLNLEGKKVEDLEGFQGDMSRVGKLEG